MRKENNEKGCKAEMKIKIKITLLANLQAVGEICLIAYLSGHAILHFIEEFQFSCFCKRVHCIALGLFGSVAR